MSYHTEGNAAENDVGVRSENQPTSSDLSDEPTVINEQQAVPFITPPTNEGSPKKHTGSLDRSVLKRTYVAAKILNQRTSGFLHCIQHKLRFFSSKWITFWPMVEP